MKKITFLCISILILACGSVKRTEQALTSGNYDQAIAIAIQNLRTKKDRKGKQPYVIMLETAFSKAKRRDHEQISYLKKDGNPANLEQIYNLYVNLKTGGG